MLQGNRGSLADQINRARELKPRRRRRRRGGRRYATAPETPLPRPAMEFFNGLGGFANDGREYLTFLEGNERTPAPWINVVANPVIRLPGLDRWQRLHLVGEQSAEPAYAVVERSRRRCARAK